MVSTIKFSEFETADLSETSNQLVGIGDGVNIKANKVTTWTTAGRPSSPYNGLIGYNTTLEAYEFYNSSSSSWIQLADAESLNATYIVQTASAFLPNAQALADLSTGILKSSAITGVLSISVPITSIDNLVTSADKMIYTTASNVYAITPLTSFARSLLADTNASNARSTLGLGTAAVKTATDNSQTYVSSAKGSFVVGHVLLAADTIGTVKDGGSPAGMGTVLEVDTGIGLTGGPITTTGTILFADVGDLTVLSNISGGSTAPTPNSLSDIIDASIGSAQGDILYRNASDWVVLTPGTSGFFLQTQGAAANPVWAVSPGSGTVTAGLQNQLAYYAANGTTVSGLATATSGILVTSAGGVPSISTDIPTAVTIGGSYIYRVGGTPVSSTYGGTGVSNPTSHGIMIAEGSSAMTSIVLSSGQILIGSTGVDPVAAAINSGTGILVANGAGSITVSLAAIADHTLLANISGGVLAPSSTTLTALIDNAIASTQGDILYRNATVWTALSPGTSGQFLTTGGAAANPSWSSQVSPTGAALTKADDTNVTLTLGGTPATALLQATSITAGWTGQLSVARGGTGVAALTAHYLLIGNGTTAVTLLAPNSTSGIPLISQGASADPAYGTSVVAGGGTGNTTFTAYSVICAGTVATGAFQNVSGVGSSGQVLTSNGAGALPSWQTGSVVTAAALTKMDDTNVTLTLGGTPATALLQATSITAGWTGQLGLTRGGTAVSLTASNGGIVYSNASTLAILAGTATAGLALLSGASTTPSWSSSPPLTRVIVQTFTSSGTYTPTSGMKYCLIECMGGGGGGGGASSGAGGYVGAAGGGSGSYASKVSTAATVGASQTVTIGAAGSAGSSGNNNGGNGGDTSVGVICVGKGGTGGQGGSQGSGGVGGVGGVSGTGDFIPTGCPGTSGLSSIGAATAQQYGGNGGSTIFGGGGIGGGASTGGAATNYGGGGGGGSSYNGSSTAGGAGTAGVIRITEFVSV